MSPRSRSLPPVVGAGLLLVLSLGAPHAVRAQVGTAPTGDPGGFGIDGDLGANTPVAGATDWVEGMPGGGTFLLTNGGAPIGADTFHGVDGYGASDLMFINPSAKLNGDPNTNWTWGAATSVAVQDLGNGLARFSRSGDGHLWCTWSLDRRGNGTNVLNAELLQGSLVRNLGGSFSASGPHGGRTIGDLVLAMFFVDPNNTNATFDAAQWLETSPGVYDYVSLLPAAGTVFCAGNAAATTPVPYGAFGSTTYAIGTFAEASVDVTALLTGGPAVAQFQTLMFTNRSSLASGSNVKDFIDPIPLAIAVGVPPVPGAGASGLRSVAPNPARGAVELTFDLAEAGPVALEVFDLAGRRVAEPARRDFGPGRHVVRWEPAGTLGAGLHFVRLTAAGRSWTRRLALTP